MTMADVHLSVYGVVYEADANSRWKSTSFLFRLFF